MTEPSTTPRASFGSRSLTWLVRKLWLPLTTTGLGLAFAGLRLILGDPGVGSVEFLTRWALFGLGYGLIVMLLSLGEEIGFGNGWTTLIAPMLGLAIAWQATSSFFTEDTVLQMFLVATIASLILTPLLIFAKNRLTDD